MYATGICKTPFANDEVKLTGIYTYLKSFAKFSFPGSGLKVISKSGLESERKIAD